MVFYLQKNTSEMGVKEKINLKNKTKEFDKILL
jgi:hypothetical protein